MYSLTVPYEAASILLSSDDLLLKQLVSLIDALLEKIKVHHILLDFSHRQVDEHASNLRGKTLHELLDEFENSATNSLLVIWVSFVDCA